MDKKRKESKEKTLSSARFEPVSITLESTDLQLHHRDVPIIFLTVDETSYDHFDRYF